jgi:HSP20 family protein
MSLIKWEPLNEFDRLLDNRLFPTLIKSFDFDLSVDVYEEKGNVVAKMSLPGLKPDDVDIIIEDDTLTVSGHREEEKEVKDKTYYCKEIRRGSFSRSTKLPKMVEVNKTEAKFEDGMLTVTVPAIKGAKGKAVKIKISK